VGGKSADQMPSLTCLNKFPTPHPDLGMMAANHHQIKGCARQALLVRHQHSYMAKATDTTLPRTQDD